jgi:hypothetical protein
MRYSIRNGILATPGEGAKLLLTVKASQKTLHRKIESQIPSKLIIPDVHTNQNVSNWQVILWILEMKARGRRDDVLMNSRPYHQSGAPHGAVPARTSTPPKGLAAIPQAPRGCRPQSQKWCRREVPLRNAGLNHLRMVAFTRSTAASRR